jgi:hypothetical protein
MLTLMTGLMFIFLQEEIQEDPAKKKFTELCQRIVQAENYGFKVTVQQEGGGFGGRGRRGGGEPAPTVYKGAFQKGKPVHVKVGEIEAYRLDESIVCKEAEGEWQAFNPESMRSAFGGRGGFGRGEGGRGGDRPPPPSEEEMIERFDKDGDGELNDEEMAEARKVMDEERARRDSERSQQRPGGLSSMRAIFSLGRFTLPHLTMENLKGKVADIQRVEQEGAVTYTVTLTKEGAETLSGASRFGRMRGGEGEGGPEFEHSATLTFTMTPEGKMSPIEIKSTMKGFFREREFEMTTKTSIEVTGVGETKVDVPEEVMTKFTL